MALLDRLAQSWERTDPGIGEYVASLTLSEVLSLDSSLMECGRRRGEVAPLLRVLGSFQRTRQNAVLVCIALIREGAVSGEGTV